MSLLRASFIVALKVVTTLSYGNPFSSFQSSVCFIKGWSFSFSNIFSVNVYLEGSLSTALLSLSACRLGGCLHSFLWSIGCTCLHCSMQKYSLCKNGLQKGKPFDYSCKIKKMCKISLYWIVPSSWKCITYLFESAVSDCSREFLQSESYIWSSQMADGSGCSRNVHRNICAVLYWMNSLIQLKATWKHVKDMET